MKHRSRQKNMFVLGVILNTLAIFFDLFSWVIDGRADLLALNAVLTTGSFVMPYLSMLVFVKYLILFVEGKWGGSKRLNQWCWRVLAVYCGAGFLLCLVGCCTGKLFTLAGNSYADGPWYLPYMASVGVIFFYLLAFIVAYARVLGLHDSLAVVTYIFFPTVGILINVFNPDISINFSLAVFSELVIYIMLQSEQESLHIEQELRLHKLVQLDELTGAMSRRAYIAALEQMEADSRVGVIFCDLNGLKYTNDHMGHEAGDRLLQALTEELHRLFRRDESFRISGDEFVVIALNLDEGRFNARCQELRARMESYAVQLASVGAAYGTGREVQTLVETAERNMRGAKQQFHRDNPKYKRDARYTKLR